MKPHVREGDESDYYSPEAKARRAAAEKAYRDAQQKARNKPKRKLLGVRVYDIGLRDVKLPMEKFGLVKFKNGMYGLPYFEGDDTPEYKKKLLWLEDYFGKGHWKLPKKK